MHDVARARRRAGWLLYAAVQFVALTTIAMIVYPGGNYTDPRATGYVFAENFFSDLGATTTWWGRTNHASAALFALALASIGAAFVGFAATWRVHVTPRGRARGLGVAGQVLATASGTAFVGVAVTPINLALDAHNTFVLAAFGLLLGATACTTIAWWRNAAPRAQLVASLLYVAAVLAYLAVTIAALRVGFADAGARRVMAVAQKLVVYASMGYVVYLTVTLRRGVA